jgi:hypothetical protein
MGYLDGLIDPSFKPKDSETTIFFPYGIGSRGYIISKQDEHHIRKFLREFYAVSLGIGLVMVATLGIHVLWLLIVLLPWYVIKTRRFLKGKERAREWYSISYTMTTMSTSMGLPMGILLALGGAGLFMVSIWVLLKTEDKFLGAVGSLFFGLGLAFELLQLMRSLWKINPFRYFV